MLLAEGREKLGWHEKNPLFICKPAPGKKIGIFLGLSSLSPPDAGDVPPLHGQEELLLLEGEDAHLLVGTGPLVVLSHAVD